MTERTKRFRSVNLTRFSMMLVGLWKPRNKFEKNVFACVLVYAILAIVFAIGVLGVDLYHCLGDLLAVMENLCGTMLLVMILIKFSSFIIYRHQVFSLISYAEEKFWRSDLDEYENTILEECDRRGLVFIYSFTFIVQMGAVNYLYAPIIINRGRNETDRVLPFKVWFDIPSTTTPYYEIIYTMQSLSTFHTGICTFCFDNFVCCLNIHVAGQLKILAHRFEVVADPYVRAVTGNIDSRKLAKSMRNAFRNCLNHHLKLIEYVDLMEQVFTWIILGQMLISSTFICAGVFQFLNAPTIFKKLIFLPHFIGSIAQLFLYSWTCNDITYQSEQIGQRIYSMKWYLLPNDDDGKLIKQGIVLAMCRLQRPCILTAGKFTPVSLQTFKNIFSTAASYLTMMQQMKEGIE